MRNHRELPSARAPRGIGRHRQGFRAVQLFAQNLTNVLASTFTNSPQWIKQEAVTQPRMAGIKVNFKFLTASPRAQWREGILT